MLHKFKTNLMFDLLSIADNCATPPSHSTHRSMDALNKNNVNFMSATYLFLLFFSDCVVEGRRTIYKSLLGW